MVSDYRLSLHELSTEEKQAILNALKECKSFNVPKKYVIFLMSEMNRMYGRELYNESNLGCRDCTNNIMHFWKTNSKKWTV